VICQYARSDAAYVLGALTPEERHQYEQHLRGCDGCTAAVREVAGLPGLLARLSADRVIAMGATGVSPEGEPPEPPVPQMLLHRLLRRVRQDRRRMRLRVAAAAAAVAALVAVGGTVGTQHLAASSPRPISRTVPLQAVGNHQLHGSVQLIAWSWGTTVRMICHADHSGADASAVYTLYATDRAGTEFAVASWRSLPEDVTVPGGIATAPDELVKFRVLDETQTVVMEGS
jgi:anti-sigma factor RsiW